MSHPGNVGLSLPTRCFNKNTRLSVMVLIMMAMKHKTNITGYHPIYETLEKIQGVSFPKELVNWLDFFNHYLQITAENRWIRESMILRNSNLQPIPWIHRTLLGGVYSNFHEVFDTPTKHFEALLNEYNRQRSSIILLMSVNLCYKILGSESLDVDPTFFGVSFSHYVFLNHLDYLYHSATVSITISTWGLCAKKDIPWETFIKGFDGFIAWGAFGKPAKPSNLSSESELEYFRNCVYQGLLVNSMFKQKYTSDSPDQHDITPEISNNSNPFFDQNIQLTT